MEYIDPEEEFELMHAQELEMMQELDEDFEPPNTIFPAPKSKRSLNFTQTCGASSTNNIKSLTPQASCSKSDSQENLSSDQDLNKILHNSDEGIQLLNGNKRTAADLFGDIEDIDLEDDHDLKRAKLEENIPLIEKQNKLIEKIVAFRKEANEFKRHPSLTSSGTNFQRRIEDCMTRNVPQWPFMPISDARGQRIYLRMNSAEYIEDELKTITASTRAGGLLPVPYQTVRKMALEVMDKKCTTSKEKAIMDDVVEVVEERRSDLWVERYKPRNYLQLLSDESTNRSLLQWLKLWDKAVFNREKRRKKAPKAEAEPKAFGTRAVQELSEELDEAGRPQFKVALLCGPPGLGKTTLAHMIAAQAGYNSVEVNASDDRSPQVFRTRLEAATQMRSVMGPAPRPNCLVLDEIDGAPLASIEVLVKFATDKGLGGKGRKGKKGATGLLRRPIICICNDVYVPALRPLRQISFTLHFPPTSSARLGERLLEICRLEALRSDLGAMMALSEKTNNDIRACLQALHCLRSSHRITLTQVKKASIGAKDTQHGLFTVWQRIFQKKSAKSEGAADPTTRLDDPGHNSKMGPILRIVQSCGEFERLAQGVYENYLNMKFRDSGMRAVSEGMRWFCFFDLVSTRIHQTQNYVLYPYLPYAFPTWHFLFSSLQWPKLSYPSVGYEMVQRSQRCNQLLDYAMSGMQSKVRAHLHKDQLLVDCAPYLLEVIVPNVRPVSAQLYTPAERRELAHVVSIMIDYNLNYTQERTQDGSIVFNLDPNFEEIGRFKGDKGRRVVGYAGRQMVSREVEMEKLRRAEAGLYKNQEERQPALQQKNTESPTVGKTAPRTPTSVKKREPQSLLQKLTPKALKKPVDMVAKDFFGRVVDASLTAVQEKAKMDDIVKSPVWFHFKEGYNNAVRKNVLMSDLY